MTVAIPLVRSILAVTALLLLAGNAAAQCSPKCEVVITVPPGNGPPQVDVQVLSTPPGQSVAFRHRGGMPVELVFTNPGKTPFLGPNGRPVETVRIAGNSSKRFSVRDDGENPCREKTGPFGERYSDCKYDVIVPGRPALDPYIIIQ
ncbi:MAG: hypothetical protein ACNS61_00730 [Candidatus Wenzhouxiangella sp. M2_3B_020]